MKSRIKTFVIDTSVILASPHSMVEDFDNNTVVICGTVIQELNGKKTAGGEIGYNAREAGRILDSYRLKGDLLKGVPTECGGTLRFEPDGVDQSLLPNGFPVSVPDNRILSTCIYLNRKNPSEPVILVTSDVLMRISATACGIQTQDFRKVMVEESEYTGYTEMDPGWETIEEIYKNKELKAPEGAGLFENEFVTLTSGSTSALTVHKNGVLHLIPKQTLFGWVNPKNTIQTYVMWALSQPAEELPLVILDGYAGTGKTMLALAAGLDGTYTSQNRKDAQYYRTLITRPVGNSFEGEQGTGYLPGSLEEKLQYLYQNYYDNLAILLRGGKKEETSQIQTQIEDMIEEGVIEVGGLGFIRGRSLTYTYLICDEAQNSSAKLIRDVITRAGIGTKIVIAGDPTQIDVPTLNKRNNGLVTAGEYMKGSPLCAYIKLPKQAAVRSPLASETISRWPG